jgi:alanine dehydrogenase
MLLLGNTDIQKLVTAKECVAWLEDAYGELADNRSASIPRADLTVAQEGAGSGSHHALKTMVGTSTRQGITALRLNSGVVSWPIGNGQVRRVKIAAASQHLGGLVMLFRDSTGEPLAVFPDRVIQRLRVGATNALAAQYLAKPSACTVGLIGSGWQAGGNLLALCSTFPINCIRVYSPNEEHCRRFAAEMMHVLECEIVCAESARQATLDVDMIVCATDALAPVIQADWLKPGVYLTCGKRPEIQPEAYRRCDILVQHYARPVDRYLIGGKEDGRPETSAAKDNDDRASVDWSNVPELRDLVVGKTARRTNDQEITCFCNNVGAGLQFAAVGARVYERAREQGLGTEIPAEWFTQDVHP